MQKNSEDLTPEAGNIKDKLNNLFVNIAKQARSEGDFKQAEKTLRNEALKNARGKNDSEIWTPSSTSRKVTMYGFSDSNLDEDNMFQAEKCIDIAQDAINNKNFERAEKFLRKSLKLYPTTRADDLMDQLHKARAEMSSEDASAAHATIVAGVNTNGKDLYEILGLSKDASLSEIQQTITRLKLQLHQDKSSTPGARDAYLRAVSEAENMFKAMRYSTT